MIIEIFEYILLLHPPSNQIRILVIFFFLPIHVPHSAHFSKNLHNKICMQSGLTYFTAHLVDHLLPSFLEFAWWKMNIEKWDAIFHNSNPPSPNTRSTR